MSAFQWAGRRSTGGTAPTRPGLPGEAGEAAGDEGMWDNDTLRKCRPVERGERAVTAAVAGAEADCTRDVQ